MAMTRDDSLRLRAWVDQAKAACQDHLAYAFRRGEEEGVDAAAFLEALLQVWQKKSEAMRVVVEAAERAVGVTDVHALTLGESHALREAVGRGPLCTLGLDYTTLCVFQMAFQYATVQLASDIDAKNIEREEATDA